MTYANHSFLVNMATAESLQRFVQPYNESPVLCAVLYTQSGHGFIPCCEIWLLPEALWKSCFLLCSTICKPPWWEKQGNLLNWVHLFLSLTIWDREKRIWRAVFPSCFYFWEGSRMVTNMFLRMCWLMKSWRDLIFGGQSDRLGRWSRKSQQLWPKKKTMEETLNIPFSSRSSKNMV